VQKSIEFSRAVGGGGVGGAGGVRFVRPPCSVVAGAGMNPSCRTPSVPR
jgi:hypothetical protein